MAVSFSFSEWIILALVLVLGWVLGLLSSRSHRARARELERDREAFLAERQAHEARIVAANARIAELERQAPVGVGASGGLAAAASGRRDDLSLIRGIGRGGETRLNDFGIHRYQDIHRLTPADEAALEGRMGAEPGFIARERWREQAELLAANRHDEHRQRFG